MTLVPNYLNYIGSKDRYLPQIIELIDKCQDEHKDTRLFVDMFCGSAVVSINVADKFDMTFCNDACAQLIALHRWVATTQMNDLLDEIDNVVNGFELSKTNKEGFLKLRETYNNLATCLNIVSPPMLYGLITHSYNYSLHFNKKGGYNAPAGTNRSYFSPTLRNKLIQYKQRVDELQNNGSWLIFQSEDFRNLEVPLKEGDNRKCLYFIDPPYSASISKHPYRNAKLKWGDNEDRALIERLDKLSEEGHKFIFTNVLKNNGQTNVILENWVKEKGYNVIPVDITYKNCSYQRRNLGETEEVIVTNF